MDRFERYLERGIESKKTSEKKRKEGREERQKGGKKKEKKERKKLMVTLKFLYGLPGELELHSSAES